MLLGEAWSRARRRWLVVKDRKPRRRMIRRLPAPSGRKITLTEVDRREGVVQVRANVEGWQAGLLRLPEEIWEELRRLEMGGGHFPYTTRRPVHGRT